MRSIFRKASDHMPSPEREGSCIISEEDAYEK